MARGKGRTTEAAQEAAPYALEGAGQAHSTNIWCEANPMVVAGAVASVTSRGDALLLTVTSDGGAASITILSGGHKPRFYPAGVEELEATLKAISDWAVDH